MAAFINTPSVRSWLSFRRRGRFVFLLTHASRGRRHGGNVGIWRLRRDFQGGVGSGGNLLLVFAGFHASAFSTALRADVFVQWPSAAPRSHAFRNVTKPRHPGVRESSACNRPVCRESGFLDLPYPLADRHRIILCHGSERPSQVLKCRSERLRARAEYPGIICTPNSFIALPTWVKQSLSAGSLASITSQQSPPLRK